MVFRYRTPDTEAWEALDPSIQEALIFHTVSTGITEVTEKTVREFYNRLSLHERVFGPLAGWDEMEITPDHARVAIGLSSNASPMTKTQFLARLNRQHLDDARRKWEV